MKVIDFDECFFFRPFLSGFLFCCGWEKRARQALSGNGRVNRKDVKLIVMREVVWMGGNCERNFRELMVKFR